MNIVTTQIKQPSPKALQKLRKYEEVRQKLLNYFFKKQPLKVNNKEALEAYSDIYLLMSNLQQKINGNDKFQTYDETYLNQYRVDLKSFCERAKQIIKMSQNLLPLEYISYILEWVYNYTRFMHWIFKTFMVIEKYSLHVKKTNLYYEGLLILKTTFIEPIMQELVQAIINCIELYKSNQLTSTTELSEIIVLFGTVGLKKYNYVKLEKQGEKFMFVSIFKDHELNNNNLNPENIYETEFFKRFFLNRLIKYLKEKYSAIANDLIKLSTPEYVQKALKYLKIQEHIANNFYPQDKVKSLVIRSLEEVLSHEKAQQLIQKPNTGLFSMLERSELYEAKHLLELIKRSSNLKMFTKQYQRFIEVKGNQILDKVSAEDEKNAKKQIVQQMIEELYQLHQLMQKITVEVADSNTEIISAQSYGFQLICNKGDNKVCNFLAYYADNILRKEEDSLNEMSDLALKIAKISKHLYSYDAFIKLYQKLLGLRMLFDNFKKKDIELGIINLLKNQAGLTSLNKISCMVSDFIFSENFNNQKANQLKNQLGLTLQVMILTSGSWQINDSKCGKSLVPPELLPAAQYYEKLYSDQFPDRKISWIFNYGRSIVLARFDNQAKHVLILNSNCSLISDYQLCILLHLQRNGFKSAKIGSLLQELKVEDEPAFNASIMMLFKAKVIQKDGNPSKIESKHEQICYNHQFKHQSLKVKCFQLPRYVEKGATQTGELVLERSHLIDAAIVKVMKSKRIIQYPELISQVQKMCKTFKAEVGMIKKRIQNCQEREFLQRDPDDMNTLVYKP